MHKKIGINRNNSSFPPLIGERPYLILSSPLSSMRKTLFRLLLPCLLACFCFVPAVQAEETKPYNAIHPFVLKSNCSPLGAPPCYQCEIIVDLFEKVAKEYEKKEEVLRHLDEVCLKVPNEFNCICKSMVEDHGPAIIELIFLREQPGEICKSIGACP